ncbi:hypothetical protein MALG_02491 [Marinovum algicola DG 898]|nr:hypothetical protein MALG_02491 [Marinovum algicola DG 898]
MSWRTKDPERLDYIWRKAQALSRSGPFTYQQLSADVGMDVKYVGTLCLDWEKEGRLQRVPVEQSMHVHMQVPEHLNRDQIDVEEGRRDTPQDRMWRVIRKLGSFDARDVAMFANSPDLAVSERAAAEFCRMLCRSGYLRVLRKEQPGKKIAVYQLVKNTGPRAPRARRLSVIWDENLGTIAHVPAEVTS